MQTVNQLLDDKGREIYTVGPDEPVYEAVRQMAERQVGALLVLDGQHLIGIVSERDYARKVILRDRASRTTPVRDIMTTEVISVTPHETVQSCMQRMTRHRIRHLPVIEDGQVQGIVSIGDLVKAVIGDQQHEIEQLQRYIAS